MGMIIRPYRSGRRQGVNARAVEYPNPLLVPRQIGNNSLKFWGKGDAGLTLGAVPRASGTAPPVVTLSGTLTTLVGLHIEIDSVVGGTGLGQATYRWSIDNGNTYVASGVLTATGPVALGTTGISVSFAAGPYNIDNKWDGTVSAMKDFSGLGNDAAQLSAGTAPQIRIAGLNGRATLDITAANQGLRTGATAVTVTADSIFAVIKLNATGAFTLFTHVTGGDNRWVFTGINDSLRTQVGGVTSSKNASAGTGWVSTAAQSVGRTYNGTHATNLVWKNMVAVGTTDVTVNDPGVASSSGQIVVANTAGFASAPIGLFAEIVVYSTALSTADMARLQVYFHNRWGI